MLQDSSVFKKQEARIAKDNIADIKYKAKLEREVKDNRALYILEQRHKRVNIIKVTEEDVIYEYLERKSKPDLIKMSKVRDLNNIKIMTKSKLIRSIMEYEFPGYVDVDE